MKRRNQQLVNFFNKYSERFNKTINNNEVDVEVTASVFADCFVEASPGGIICGKNNKEFRKAIPEGYKFYKQIGIVSMDIKGSEITNLDRFHDMVKIHWKSSFNKKDATIGSIEFDVIYLIQTLGEESKIFGYITGDEQAALKENGLL